MLMLVGRATVRMALVFGAVSTVSHLLCQTKIFGYFPRVYFILHQNTPPPSPRVFILLCIKPPCVLFHSALNTPKIRLNYTKMDFLQSKENTEGFTQKKITQGSLMQVFDNTGGFMHFTLFSQTV